MCVFVFVCASLRLSHRGINSKHWQLWILFRSVYRDESLEISSFHAHLADKRLFTPDFFFLFSPFSPLFSSDPPFFYQALRILRLNWWHFHFPVSSPENTCFFQPAAQLLLLSVATTIRAAAAAAAAKRCKHPERQTETLHHRSLTIHTVPVQRCQAEHNRSGWSVSHCVKSQSEGGGRRQETIGGEGKRKRR